jgi:hypothetical protein
MSGPIKNAIQQATQGKAFTPRGAKPSDHMAQQMSVGIAETISWDTLKRMYMRVYAESLTQA